MSDPVLFNEPVIITGRDYSHLITDQLESSAEAPRSCSSRYAAIWVRRSPRPRASSAGAFRAPCSSSWRPTM